VPLYHARHVAGTIPPRESTPAMQLGTALHLAVLEHDRFTTEVVTAPPGINRRTNDGKAEWCRFLADSAGKTILDAKDYNLCRNMAASILDHRKAVDAIRLAEHVEYAIRWQDQSRLWVRNLIDALVPGQELLINLKTAADPSPEAFSRAIANYGYHRSSSLYLRGAREALGMLQPRELFIVVGKEPPHEVACYLIDAESLAAGQRANRLGLDELARRRETGNWSSRHADKIEEIGVPRWALMQE
jgi:PDDEXK-like domain of unknown function (DUF3799)